MGPFLAQYSDQLFMAGEEVPVGTKTLAAVLHRWPKLGRRSPRSLPEARQALQGWQRAAPLQSRLPLPWLMVAGIADYMAEHHSCRMAFLTVLAFHCYLRPGVAAKLAVEYLTPPVSNEGPEALWNLNLQRQEHEKPSKTGTWDETVIVGDSPSWTLLSKLIAVLWRSSQSGGKQSPQGRSRSGDGRGRTLIADLTMK